MTTPEKLLADLVQCYHLDSYQDFVINLADIIADAEALARGEDDGLASWRGPGDYVAAGSSGGGSHHSGRLEAPRPGPAEMTSPTTPLTEAERIELQARRLQNLLGMSQEAWQQWVPFVTETFAAARAHLAASGGECGEGMEFAGLDMGGKPYCRPVKSTTMDIKPDNVPNSEHYDECRHGKPLHQDC